MRKRTAFINAIGTAVPDQDIHANFIAWAGERIADPRERSAFYRMTERSGIQHRWSVLAPTPGGGSPVDPGGFYAGDALPSTARRMELYAQAAPSLAMKAIRKLAAQTSIDAISHLVVASCTGFVAPGVDQIIADRMGLGPDVERTFVGFMGCYAAVAALRVAHHIVRSEPSARVLVVTVEISSVHLQSDSRIEPLLSMLQFGDGAAAALVTAEPAGLGIGHLFALTLPDTADLIRWTIGDEGFAMHLSGQVPGQIAQALGEESVRKRLMNGSQIADVDAWAVHAGGRSILDAVEQGLGLSRNALKISRRVLADYGNMSSSTLMFALAAFIDDSDARTGLAMAFGPGLAAEGFSFGRH